VNLTLTKNDFLCQEKCFLHKVTEQLFSLPHDLFLFFIFLERNSFFLPQEKNSCVMEKKISREEKNVLSLFQ